ncbi:uncharacterized protein LOC131531435 isoform X9 [Onychostoma macrolepis]|uniref:uncharacterized protein LOC131531435 isoform X9 n=1 Tax=Onychostoma macrolepis TaxID=369639 RepID=UPI00272A0451|nr:uncharacterized protein LOC131531435 isoform X9 [Onychostoma macrolepis]
MDESVTGVSNLQSTLSFEQQKELLLLQMEHEKLKQRSEGSKLELERARLEVETLKLKLAKEEGRVCLVGEEEIPVKILRDTGSMDSFILESVLPFSSQSHTAEEFGKEQRADSSLDALFQCAVTPAEMSNLARGSLCRSPCLMGRGVTVPVTEFLSAL